MAEDMRIELMHPFNGGRGLANQHITTLSIFQFVVFYNLETFL